MSTQYLARKFLEWLGAASLLAMACALIAFSKQMPFSYQIVLWGIWIAILAWIFRRGWIALFGPVFSYDLIRTGRRTRNILLRCGYALALLLVLYIVYLEHTKTIQELLHMRWAFTEAGLQLQIRQELAKFAESFFIMFMEVQFIGIFLLTPAYVAGAIAEEKDRRTLEYLLTTDLENREIVLGKMISRLIGLMLLILTGLPILSLVQFFGGVDPDLVISGFATTGLTMASLSGLSVFCSVCAKKPRDAIVLTYLIVVAYLVFSGLSRWLISTPRIGAVPLVPQSWSDLLEWFSSGNLFVVIRKLRAAQGTGLLLQQVLPGLMANYAVVHGISALALAFWAIMRLRASTKDTIEGSQRTGRRFWSWRSMSLRSSPMLWKELHLESRLGFNRLGRTVIALIVLASFLPALSFVYEHLQGNSWNNLELEMAVNQWVRAVGTLVASLVLLGVGLRAAGAVSGERERQTLDSLMTSPLTSQEILLAKWLASIWTVRWAWLWLCAIWGLGVLTGGMEAACLPWLILAWCVYAGFMAALGLYFSTIHFRTQRASIWMLAVSLLLYGVPMLFSYFLRILAPAVPSSGGGGWLGHVEFMAMIPPVALNWLAFRLYDLDLSVVHHREEPMGVLVGITIGLMIWAGMSCWLWKLTIRRFNLLTGRQKVHVVDKAFTAHYPKFGPVVSSQ